MSVDLFSFNHIDKDLPEDEVKKLKELYKHYHLKEECYRRLYKKLRRTKICIGVGGVALSAIGVVAGAITVNPIVLGCITGPGLVMTAYLTQSGVNDKIVGCKFAYTSYKKILDTLRTYLRGIGYDETILMSDLKVLDDIVTDQCPPIAKMSAKYKARRYVREQ